MGILKFFLLPLLVAVWASSTGFGQTADKVPPTPQATVLSELESSDPAAIQKGIAELKSLEDSGSFLKTSGLEAKAISAAFKDQEYDACSTVASESVLKYRYNDILHSQDLLIMMVRCKLAMGKPEEALSIAKTLYAYCAMEKTRDAIVLIEECLKAAHKEDGKTVIDLFHSQQVAGSKVTPDAPSAEAKRANVLTDIPGYPDLSTEADRIAQTNLGDSVIWRENKIGNLLLLAGKPEEAEAEFRTAMATTSNEAVNRAAIAGVARAIRAEDNTLGRANNFILTLNRRNDGSNKDSVKTPNETGGGL
jgi:hypothetical protein